MKSGNLEFRVLDAKVCLYKFFVKEKLSSPTAYALVTENDTGKDACLFHIYTKKQYRRTGIAQAIIQAMQTKYNRIYTGVNTKEGDSLCYKCGFAMVKPIFKDGPYMLVWERKHACQKNMKR